jgi:hypothetical protein
VNFTKHAKERMEERGVSEDDIRLAVNRHIGPPEPGSSAGSICYIGPPTGGRRLKVVCSAADTDFIISVMWIT